MPRLCGIFELDILLGAMVSPLIIEANVEELLSPFSCTGQGRS